MDEDKTKKNGSPGQIRQNCGKRECTREETSVRKKCVFYQKCFTLGRISYYFQNIADSPTIMYYV